MGVLGVLSVHVGIDLWLLIPESLEKYKMIGNSVVTR